MNFHSYVHGVIRRGSKRLTRAPLDKLLRELLSEEAGLGRVLFVGAGGELERLVRTILNQSVTTIDVDAKRRPDIVMSVTDLDFSPNSFDTVILAEVLEHVKEPWRVDAQISGVLSHGGALVISTPFLFPIHDEPHDYWRFTSFGLARLFPSFEVVKILNRAGYLQTLTAVGSRLVRHRGLAFVLGVLFTFSGLVLFRVFRLFDRFLPDVGPLGYVAKFRKFSAPNNPQESGGDPERR